MDFMRWLNSLGDLLYEVMSWLIFYPITLWRTIVRPLDMMSYSDQELSDSEDEQFTDTLNPPLFLVLSLLLTQAADHALGGGTNPIVAQRTGLAGFVKDDTSLLLLRLIIFSLFPLMMAARFLRVQGVKLTRKALKSPFYAQCYACAPFALFLGMAVSLSHLASPEARLAGPVLSAGSVFGYLAAETMWFARHLGRGVPRAFGNVLRAFVQASVMAFALGFLFVAH